MDRLFNMLTELSVDPFKQHAFARDPARVIAESGLDSTERALLAGWGRAEHDGAIASGAWTRGAAFFDPGEDPPEEPELPEEPDPEQPPPQNA